jgi:hypothetical protein
MAPRFESRGRQERPRPPDPVELGAQLVMLPAEVLWSVFGRAMLESQLRVLRAMTRRSGGQPGGPAPRTSASTSRSTDNPR